MNNELLQEAIEIFGPETVQQVQMVVDVSDTDGAWSLFNDMGHFEHMECVEFLYFEN